MKNLAFLFVLAYLIESCDSKDPSPSSSSGPEISMQIMPKVNGVEAKLNRYYHLKNGDSLLFSRLDFYMENVEFKDKSGKFARADTAYLFSSKNATNKFGYKSSSLPTSIDTLMFLCGLGDITNSLDPNNYPENHPLSSWKNMYWTMGSKYRFVVLEGNIKTSSGTLIPYSFHTGLEYKYQAKLPVNIVLNVSSPKLYSLIVHLDRVFYPVTGTSIDYTASETQAHGDAADGPLTDKVALNFSKAFSIE